MSTLQDFNAGPFDFYAGPIVNIAGAQRQRWMMQFRGRQIAERTAPARCTRDDVLAEFESARSDVLRELRAEHAPHLYSIVDAQTDESIGLLKLAAHPAGGGHWLVDARHGRHWLRACDADYSLPASLEEIAAIAQRLGAPANHWIAGVLDDDVLTQDAAAWRAPDADEVKMVVGPWSLSGTPAARAAELVGVDPKNFRKYTAGADSAHRQALSYSMWHTLLHKLGIQRMRADV